MGQTPRSDPMTDPWHEIETGTLQPEAPLLSRLIAGADLTAEARARIAAEGAAHRSEH